jgi:DASS family divalent anion:Na+ symporter
MKPPPPPALPAAPPDTTALPASLAAWALTLLLPVAAFGQAATRLPAPAALLVALMVGAAVQWVFRLVPDFVVGLLLLLLCVLLDVAPPELAFSGFASPVFLLVLGVFLLSAQLAESPWMARWSAALLRHTQGCTACRLGAVVLSALLLTLVLPSPMGRSALLAPLLPALVAGRSPRTQTAVVFALAQGHTLWSTVFLTGNPLNFVLLGLLDLQSQLRFQWLHWLWAAMIFGLVVGAGLAVLLAWLLHGGGPAALSDMPGPGADPSNTGPGGRAGRGGPGGLPGAAAWQAQSAARDAAVPVLYLLLFAAVLTRPLHQVELHLVVGVLALLSCYLLPMPLQTLRARLDWPTLLFIATLAAWQPMLAHAGVDDWLAAQLPALARHMPASPQLGIVALAVLVGLVRLVVPGAPAFIVLATGALPLAPALGLSPWVLGFVLLSVSEGFVFAHQHGVPSHLESEARVLGLQLQRRRLLLAHLLAWLLRMLALVASVPWWKQLGVV